MGLWTDIMGACLDLVYPGRCGGCGASVSYSDGVLCKDCSLLLLEAAGQDGCPTCGHSITKYEIIDGQCHNCSGMDNNLDYVIRVCDYKQPLKQVIWQLKYEGQSRYDRFLGKLAADAAMGRPAFGQVDLLVPVPLHWLRQLRRGYNQSKLLAKEIARNLKLNGRDIDICYDLIRIKNTPPQTILSESRRKRNLQGAFAVCPGSAVKGSSVCLIDDVTTTGATLQMAGRILRKAGASSVGAIVLCVPDTKK